MKKKTICIFGASLETGNLGVSALSKSLISIFSNHYEYDVILMSSQKENSEQTKKVFYEKECYNEIRSITYFTKPRFPLSKSIGIIWFIAILYRFLPLFRKTLLKNEFIKCIVSSDIVGDIRGGDSFSDIYGLKRFQIGSLPLLICRILKQEVVLLPQKYGPFRTKLSKKIASKTFNYAKFIYCRDYHSCNVAENLISKKGSSKILLSPDVAFHLPSIQPYSYSIRGDKKILEKKFIGINISGLLWIGGYSQDNMFGLKNNYKEMILCLIQKLQKEFNLPILLIPHTLSKNPNVNSSESDLDASLELIELIQNPEKISLLEGIYDASELKWIISNAEFFCGARMHACIAAISQSVPTIGHAYSDKFLGVFKTAGVENSVIDLRYSNISEVLDKTSYIFQHKDEIISTLRNEIPVLKDKTIKSLDVMIN